MTHSFSSRARCLAAAALLPLIAGCLSVGPDFRAPEWDGPEAWSATNAPVASPLPDGAPWWSVFGDPVLDGLEAELLEQNLSLAAAVARLDSVDVWKSFAGPDTPRPTAEETHAEAAEFAESESHAENAETAESISHAESAETAEPEPSKGE